MNERERFNHTYGLAAICVVLPLLVVVFLLSVVIGGVGAAVLAAGVFVTAYALREWLWRRRQAAAELWPQAGEFSAPDAVPSSTPTPAWRPVESSPPAES